MPDRRLLVTVHAQVVEDDGMGNWLHVGERWTSRAMIAEAFCRAYIAERVAAEAEDRAPGFIEDSAMPSILLQRLALNVLPTVGKIWDAADATSSASLDRRSDADKDRAARAEMGCPY